MLQEEICNQQINKLTYIHLDYNTSRTFYKRSIDFHDQLILRSRFTIYFLFCYMIVKHLYIIYIATWKFQFDVINVLYELKVKFPIQKFCKLTFIVDTLTLQMMNASISVTVVSAHLVMLVKIRILQDSVDYRRVPVGRYTCSVIESVALAVRQYSQICENKKNI